MKPAYQLEVTDRPARLHRRRPDQGRRSTRRFFEGTPVAGVPLRIDGYRRAQPSRPTPPARRSIARRRRPSTDQEGPTGRRSPSHPARAEEGEINGASRDVPHLPEQPDHRGRRHDRGWPGQGDRRASTSSTSTGSKPPSPAGRVWDLDPRGAPRCAARRHGRGSSNSSRSGPRPGPSTTSSRRRSSPCTRPDRRAVREVRSR